MDLFTPIVPSKQFHPNFAKCLGKRNPHDEALISKWAEGFVDRDGKFVKEFQTTFNLVFCRNLRFPHPPSRIETLAHPRTAAANRR